MSTTGSVANNLREMDIVEFLRRLKSDDQQAEQKFALFLGAGCSVSSGIPAASELVYNHWLPRLKNVVAPDATDSDVWAATRYAGYTRDKAAAYYGRVMDDLFITPNDRQREVESLCSGKSPGFGYAVLAQLVAKANGRFNVVLTTNFDDLVADALYLYTDSRPLVIHHESLAAFIRPTRTRPLVVKLHGDHRLAPRNTVLETKELEDGFARHTAMVLNDRGLIFMGYGGNDESIQSLLMSLPGEALPAGVFWVHPTEPKGRVREWLLKRQGVWVKSGWFDEVMLLARNAFGLDHPETTRFDKIFESYRTTFEKLSKEIAAKPVGDADTKTLRAAVATAEEHFLDYMERYARFLEQVRNDKQAAEKIRERAASFAKRAKHVTGPQSPP